MRPSRPFPSRFDEVGNRLRLLWVKAFAGLVIFLTSVGPVIGQTTYPIVLAPGVSEVGAIEHYGILESSGLTESKRHPGVFYTHNDGGTPPFLFAMDKRGRHIGAYEVQGARMIDWEAVAVDQAGALYLADIGTNGLLREHSAIHLVEEPDLSQSWGRATVTRTWYIRFPGQREDCESFFVSDGYGYLITKYPVDGRVRMYRFLLSDASESILLEPYASIPMKDDVSDAALSADKSRLALLTNDGVYIFFINGRIGSIARAPSRITEFNGTAMEGVAFLPEGLLVTSESSSRILLFDSADLAGAPVFTISPTDRTVSLGEDVTFTALATGFPAPTYTWTFNGVAIPGATSFSLTISNVTLANAGEYEVIASNAAGSARSSARLAVRDRTADVRITEVMSSEAPGALTTQDWWELTSFDTQVVNLSGWRFNDGRGDLSDAFIIPEGVTIAPGETIVFVEEMTAAEFRAWWGESRIDPGLQIVTYSGDSLSFSALGDSVRLWDDLATSVRDVLVRVDFGVAEPGVSFIYDPQTEEFGARARPGVLGAFRSTEGNDVGSPGVISGEPVEAADVRITEVMSSQSPGAVSSRDWWELTSFHPETVDLSGWRFNDSEGDLTDAFVIPEGTRIAPGETMIFVEEMTSEEFLTWWGRSQLAADLQIITYSGSSLSFSSLGDSLRLWSDEAAGTNDLVAQVEFGAAEAGVSFIYNPITREFGAPARVGQFGAFESATGSDVGSPGRITGTEEVDVRITEVMSSETAGPLPTRDWWELTSFETEILDLSGWRFNDSAGDLSDAFVLPEGLTIAPGETIVFVEEMTAAEFRTWWGESAIDPDQKIVTYSGSSLSFSSLGDSLRLWSDEAASTNDMIALVEFGAAEPGVSFIYNPLTGEFGAFARIGIFGAFGSAMGSDVGSPGRIAGGEERIDLRITEVMSSETPGAIPTEDWWELTSFHAATVDLSGWRFNDNVGDLADAFVLPEGLTIAPGETIVFVEDMTPEEFRAWWGESQIDPGLKIITYTGSSLSFSATGDSVRLWDDETTEVQQPVTQADFGMAETGVSFVYDPLTGEFGVRSRIGVFGAFASASGSDIGSPGRITGEAERVDVRITEVMSSETPGAVATEDWWELTSFHSEPVDLSGWRFNDNEGDLSDAFVIPEGVLIAPGERIVFVEDMMPAEFRAWWGESQIDPDLQIVTYTGTALSFSSLGDSVRLWDDRATDVNDLVTRVVFGAAEPGVSFIYDPVTGVFGVPSRAGVFGAFRSSSGDDVGSPGRIDASAAAGPYLAGDLSENRMMIRFHARAGNYYSLEARESVSSGDWIATGDTLYCADDGLMQFSKPEDGDACFYRVRKE